LLGRQDTQLALAPSNMASRGGRTDLLISKTNAVHISPAGAMNGVTEALSVNSRAGKGNSPQHFFNICYIAATVAATFGWLSALGWAAVKIAQWAWA
jgi:hypothetical protein